MVSLALRETAIRHSINSTLGGPLAPVLTFRIREKTIAAGIPNPERPGRALGTTDYAMPAGFSLYGAKLV